MRAWAAVAAILIGIAANGLQIECFTSCASNFRINCESGTRMRRINAGQHVKHTSLSNFVANSQSIFGTNKKEGAKGSVAIFITGYAHSIYFGMWLLMEQRIAISSAYTNVGTSFFDNIDGFEWLRLGNKHQRKGHCINCDRISSVFERYFQRKPCIVLSKCERAGDLHIDRYPRPLFSAHFIQLALHHFELARSNVSCMFSFIYRAIRLDGLPSNNDNASNSHSKRDLVDEVTFGFLSHVRNIFAASRAK